MRSFVLCCLLVTAPLHAAAVSLCDVFADPAKYDRHVIDITTFVSHGFEDFTLFDPRCSSEEVSVWVEYGGTFSSGTIYCCGVSAERSRKEPLVVQDIPTAIVEDEALKRFDRLIQQEPDSIVHATLRGRFFAGEKHELPGGTRWVGFGHFGLSTLFVIEQVLSVDPHDLRDVDYRATADPPDSDCVGYDDLPRAAALAQQRQADAGERAWAFTDPKRVAKERLGVTRLRQVAKAPGRVIYHDAQKRFRVVVSRPYWLTFFAAKRDRVAWIPIAVYDTQC